MPNKLLKHSSVLEKDLDMSLTFETDEVRPLSYDVLTFLITWSGGTVGTDGVISFEVSHDGLEYHTAEISDVLTVGGVSGTHFLTAKVDFKSCRLKYTAAAGGGLMSIVYTAKAFGGLT